jgi:rhodanese-related sulfurtransferase
MNRYNKSSLFCTLLILSLQFHAHAQTGVKPHAIVYSCLPCGRSCDTITSKTPGLCSICHMQLVDRSTIHFKSISPAQISQYLKKHPDVVLLDVRTKEEFEQKADSNFAPLKNAINIPVQDLEGRLGSIAYLKKRKIIVYCSHSHRSAVASYLLTQNGFHDVTNMSGGVSVMKAGEYPK